MSITHDPRIIKTVLRIFAQKLLDCGLDFLDEFVNDSLADEDVIAGDAGLAGVDDLGPDDASSGDGKVGVIEDDAGALAAELEGDGGEMLGGSSHDDLADEAAARVGDLVE